MSMRPPNPSDWNRRDTWLGDQVDAVGGRPALGLGPQADAMFEEMCACFRTGAWLATVILAQTVLDAQMVETEEIDGTVLNELRLGRDYVWLRNRRNALLHREEERLAITIDERRSDAAILEREARRAVELVIKGLGGAV